VFVLACVSQKPCVLLYRYLYARCETSLINLLAREPSIRKNRSPSVFLDGFCLRRFFQRCCFGLPVKKTVVLRFFLGLLPRARWRGALLEGLFAKVDFLIRKSACCLAGRDREIGVFEHKHWESENDSRPWAPILITNFTQKFEKPEICFFDVQAHSHLSLVHEKWQTLLGEGPWRWICG